MSPYATRNHTKPITKPITEMTEKDVEKDRLKSFVLYNAGESESGFTEWWKSHKDTDAVKVKIPYERHRLAKQSSIHAKQGMMADFLHFVDMNSQPNDRHAGIHSTQFFLQDSLGLIPQNWARRTKS